MTSLKPLILAIVLLLQLSSAYSQSATAGTLVDREIISNALEDNLLHIEPKRQIKIYLPASYDQGKRRYPVIYYFHNFGWTNTKLFGDGNQLKQLLDRAMASGQLKEAIVVAGDFTTPGIGAFYSNAASSGRWLDHITQELVPFIDKQFRTLPAPASRAVVGDMIGGYAAIKLGMLYPEIFGSVYAMHPVGTATGETLMQSRPDWRQMNEAKSWQDLETNIYSKVFMLMAQSYLPNPHKPPFYADLMVELKDDVLTVNTTNVRTLRENFLLDAMLPKYAENMKKLRGFKMDWGRYDENPDHVYANQKFTRMLEDFGVQHEAEEYGGNHWNRYWQADGRVYEEVLPFLNRYLQGE
jgi:enterochelin esterase-like enzyme